ncbi:hypothetical protein HZB89_00680, partial [archaeon]|nr:hypothetical protein [archaeon]
EIFVEEEAKAKKWAFKGSGLEEKPESTAVEAVEQAAGNKKEFFE